MTAQPAAHHHRQPAGSPAGGQFAAQQRHEPEVSLDTPPEWQPSDTDFADLGRPLPRSYRQYGEPDDYTLPEDEYMGQDEKDFWADYGEQRWFGGTLAGGR